MDVLTNHDHNQPAHPQSSSPLQAPDHDHSGPDRLPHQETNGAVEGSNGRFHEQWDASQRGSSVLGGPRDPHPRLHNANSMADPSPMADGGGAADIHRSASVRSYAPGDDQLPAMSNRHGTLKKRNSTRHAGGSLRHSSSRRSMKAGSVKSLGLYSGSDQGEAAHSVFHCPVPTSGSPTDVLANRFQSAHHRAPTPPNSPYSVMSYP